MSAVLEILSWICLVAGSIFCVIGGVGILRMPDFYTRTHAASITDTMGAGLVLAGLFFQGVDLMFTEELTWVPDMWLVPAKIVFLALFIMLTSPTAGHALVKAAYAHGLCATVSEGFGQGLVEGCPVAPEGGDEEADAPTGEEGTDAVSQ